MKALIIGCGRVGSTIARQLLDEEWEVTVVDENEDALSRLGENWPGTSSSATAWTRDLLRAAGIEEADAVVVATDGDNTNIVISQVAQKRFGIECVVARILDPARADFYAARGLRTVCPTKTAIDILGEAVRACASRRCPPDVRRRRRRRQGRGKRRAVAHPPRNEVTLIEQRRDRFERLEEEFEHQVQRGDATELFVLERAGITRPPDIMLALTGDDEDNMVICQLAKEKYGVPKVIARVNDPRNQPHFDLLGISPTICATSSIMALVQHEVPEHELIHLLELRRENLEIVEVQIDKSSPVAGKRVEGLKLPEGARLISVMRDGRSEIAVGSTTLEAGDQVLAILEPGKEDELRRVLLKR